MKLHAFKSILQMETPNFAKILAKPKTEQKELFEKLRNEVVFKHNVQVMESGIGHVIVRRQSKICRSAEEFLPCPHCYGFL